MEPIVVIAIFLIIIAVMAVILAGCQLYRKYKQTDYSKTNWSEYGFNEKNDYALF